MIDWMTALAAAVMISAAASAQTPACKEGAPGLAAKAKVTCADAQKTALARVPHATVKSAGLEEEKGKLVYSFDLKRRGKSGVEEVQVDAVSGQVVSVEHESAKHEAAEKDEDLAAAARLGELARRDLASRLGVPAEKVKTISLRPHTWSDASLGCPKPDMSYAQMETKGFVIELEAGGKKYGYHSDMQRLVPCDQ
jgi:hypothetical protein